MRVFFVRHGDKRIETEINPKIKHTDPSLSEIGEKQAQRLGDYFKNIDLKKIYVSEYRRNHQTAWPLSQLKGLSIIEDKRLNEIDTGLIELMSEEEIKEKYFNFWTDFNEKKKDCRFPGGENGEEVKTRQEGLLKDLVSRNEDCLLVSHDGFIRILMCNILGMPVYRRHLFKTVFCGITELNYDYYRREWNILNYNWEIDLRS